MVITEKFVYIHKPKTGGTFVTDALLKLYDGTWNLLVHLKLATLKVVHYENELGKLSLTANKHGGCSDIPRGHQQKIIVSTIRNPFDYYVSQYEFGWWKRKEWVKYYRGFAGFSEKFPSFPDITFRQFMELIHLVFNPPGYTDFDNAETPGRNTIEFIDMYFKSPSVIYDKISVAYAQSDLMRDDMHPVHFIFTHKLNQQLHEFLIEMHYPPDKISFILKKEKMLPQGKGRTEKQPWQNYYTDDLIDLVRKKDAFLFSLFPEFCM
jgi:hypothetical protein